MTRKTITIHKLRIAFFLMPKLGWCPSLPNIISVNVRLQEYSDELKSKYHSSSKTQGQPLQSSPGDGTEAHGQGSKTRPDEYEFESSFEIKCERTKSVLALKDKIAEATGFGTEFQKLLHAGRYAHCDDMQITLTVNVRLCRELLDHCNVADCGIHEKATLHLIISPALQEVRQEG
jgi:hypothetical protein